jgi:hypothetical protein
MSQNVSSITFTNDQIVAIDKTIGELETQLHGLASLSIGARRSASKMGPKSETFCRQTINVLQLNPQVVPPSIGIEDARAHLDALDQLRPLFQRMHRLSARSTDTELALGSGVMVTALQGYGVLKAVGRNQGLEVLRRELGERRFTAKGGRPTATAQPAPNPLPVAA